MSNNVNTKLLELASDHIDYWNEAGNSLWVEIIERCVERHDLEELNVQLIKSVEEMKQLDSDETFGTGEVY